MTTIPLNIALIQDYFKDKPVLKAYLFGSFARGDADASSGIDILIVLDYSEKNRTQVFHNATRVTGTPQ